MGPRRLLGRDRELAVLRDALFAGVDGPRSVVLVTGDAGIGKSALLTQVRTEATAAGFRVLSAVGVESEMHLPFGGLQQVLSPLMDSADELPQLQREALYTALGLFAGPRPDLFLIAESALHLLSLERARRPVLVLADDLQWLDPQSHQVITFVGHRSQTAGVGVLGAARSGYEGPFIAGGFPVLDVPGVDQAAADTILNGHPRSLSAAERRSICGQAQGNPLALLELPAVWAHSPGIVDGPRALSTRLERAFAGRIVEFPAVTKDALLLAATVGDQPGHHPPGAAGWAAARLASGTHGDRRCSRVCPSSCCRFSSHCAQHARRPLARIAVRIGSLLYCAQHARRPPCSVRPSTSPSAGKRDRSPTHSWWLWAH